MATLGNSVLTLNDWAKRLDPDGKVAMTVEILSQTNGILEDMMFKEGNLPTGEQTTIRTGLPEVYYRKMNMGVPKSKSTTVQVTENAASLNARSEVDVKIAKLNGNVGAFRLDEGEAFVEAMAQQQANTLLYGTNANPEEFEGFIPRYNDLSAVNAENILDAGGTGSDNASVMLVGWGQKACFGVFPKGSTAGISHQDLGEIDAFDSNNDRFRAFADLWEWDNGLVVKDWRYAVRIANIDIPALEAQTGTQLPTASTALIKLMSRSIDRLPNQTSVNAAFYANRTVLSLLRVAALDKSNSAVTIEPGLNQFGETIHTMRFLGIPVRLTDALINTEARVV
jgi:hypothetical protein